MRGGGRMANRTQIVCLHEGTKGSSIDPIFIRALIQALAPPWIRPFQGSNIVRLVNCGGRTEVIRKLPSELRACLATGGLTTLMVWADMDDDIVNGEDLKRKFWSEAQRQGIGEAEFAQVVFAFAKDRIENWIEFLATGYTDEGQEGPRVKHNTEVVEAAKTLARRCKQQQSNPPLPSSLEWSCRNWRALVDRMKVQ